MSKKLRFFIISWLITLSVILYASSDYLLEGKITDLVVSYVKGKEKTDLIEVTDFQVDFSSKYIAVIGFTVEAEKSKYKIGEIDFILKNEILNVSSDIEYKNLKDTVKVYEEIIKDKMSNIGVEVKGFYITQWLVVHK